MSWMIDRSTETANKSAMSHSRMCWLYSLSNVHLRSFSFTTTTSLTIVMADQQPQPQPQPTSGIHITDPNSPLGVVVIHDERRERRQAQQQHNQRVVGDDVTAQHLKQFVAHMQFSQAPLNKFVAQRTLYRYYCEFVSQTGGVNANPTDDDLHTFSKYASCRDRDISNDTMRLFQPTNRPICLM
jgi:hypothetical protein